MEIVPVVVTGPPVRPVPVATDVTVPLAVDGVVQVGALPEPAEVSTCPFVPATLVSVRPEVIFGVANVGAVPRTLLPVPVFVTLTKFLDASVATALDAVSAENIALALNVAVPPTNKPLVIPTPPAVKIEPVEPLVVSVARLELMPCANGIRAVVAVCPSFVIAVDKPVAKSAVSALNAVLLITVPVTTGWPEVLIWNVPEPL